MPRSGQPARILLVEHEPEVAEPLARALGRAGFATTTATTASEALASAERAPPDLVVLDLGLPDANAHELSRALQRRRDVAVVMVAASLAEADRDTARDGADDYIVASMPEEEAVGRISAVLRRVRRAAPGGSSLLRLGPLAIDLRARRARLDGRPLPLTRKELDLLIRLVRDAGRVVPRETLMDDVWGAGWHGATRTLDVHVGWLRRKLGHDPAQRRRRLIHPVRGVGFRFASEEELRR